MILKYNNYLFASFKVSTIMHKKLLIGVFGLSLLFSSCALFTPSAGKLYKQSLSSHNQYDAVIVPGVPFKEPAWDNVMLMRVTWAVHLYKIGLTKTLIMSGSSVYTPYVEAKIMKLYAMALGVPEDKIIIESRAEHSTENVWYGYHLGKQNGLNNIALATDPFQTKILYRFGKKHTKDLAYLPVLFDTLKTLPHLTPDINYTAIRLNDFVSLPERQSWWKRFKGTRGKNINLNESPSPQLVNQQGR